MYIKIPHMSGREVLETLDLLGFLAYDGVYKKSQK
jgi:hypothetical protein